MLSVVVVSVSSFFVKIAGADLFFAEFFEKIPYKLTIFWQAPPPPLLQIRHLPVDSNVNVPGIDYYILAPVAETGFSHTCFSHRLTAYKIVGHFFGLSYRKISGSNQVKNRFFRISSISVPCPHAQLRGCTVIKKLWTFFGPWGRDRSQSPPCWIFRVKQIHPSTASERTTRQIISHPLAVVSRWSDPQLM